MNDNDLKNLPELSEEKPLEKSEIRGAVKDRLAYIGEEFKRGFDFIEQYEKSVTIFGSARFSEDHPDYVMARRIAGKISKLGFTIVTGGGGGIMEAANRGAFENGGSSIGLAIKLPHEQKLNPYTTNSTEFYYFFTRKVAMSFATEAYIFFPGGFGTLNEFFETITLLQTGKMPRVPIILFGTEFWNPLANYIRAELLDKHKTISPEDAELYTITDDEDATIEIIKNAPLISNIEFKIDRPQI